MGRYDHPRPPLWPSAVGGSPSHGPLNRDLKRPRLYGQPPNGARGCPIMARADGAKARRRVFLSLATEPPQAPALRERGRETGCRLATTMRAKRRLLATAWKVSVGRKARGHCPSEHSGECWKVP